MPESDPRVADDLTILPEEARNYPYDVRPGEYVLLEVSDTGPGIAPHLREQVFDVLQPPCKR